MGARIVEVERQLNVLSLNRHRLTLIFISVFSAAAIPGCRASPVFRRVVVPLDAGSPVPGDATAATGGSTGSGGIPGSGGAVGSGGVVATGGNSGIGGIGGIGGQAGTGTGGTASGGSGIGGVGTGGQGTGGSATGGSGNGGGGADPDLVLWYSLDESSGVIAVDSAMSGGTARNATLTTIGTGGGATFSTMKQVGTHAVSLTPAATAANANGGYVTVPSLQSLAPDALTIAVWVNLAANTATQNWERIFDFGSGIGTMPNMYLAARAADATTTPIRFAITTTGHAATAEQRLDGATALSANAWHHIAVVLPAGSPFAGTLYIDGASVATNNAMTLHATDLGATTNNWLGRSQFSDTMGSNPCFAGLLDDFRVYRRALSQAEISVLFAVR